MAEADVLTAWPAVVPDEQMRETDSDETQEELLRRLFRRIEHMEDIQRERVSNRSTDTLRRDIGIFAILLGMMVQTGAAFFWAGGMSRSSESLKETMTQVQQEQSYQRAQLQVLDGKMQRIQGQQDEREKQRGK